MLPAFHFFRTLLLLITATGLCCAPIAEAIDARATYHAAQRGNVDAMRKMGVWSRDGKMGIPRNYSTAEDWFQKAANTGDVQALFLLGDLYKNRGNKPKSALECYTKAHRREPEKAKKKIFTLPFSTAKETIEEWAEKGDEDCLKFLLEAYLQGKHGISRNFEKASHYYKRAERQHPALAQKFAKKLSEAELQRLNPEAHREKAAQERAAALAEQARQQAESERAAREARERAERERRLAEAAKRTQQEKLKAQQEALKQAFARNDAAKAKKLIKEGVQIERSAIEAALAQAAQHDLGVDTLRLAQSQGVDLHFLHKGNSLLHIAAEKQKPAIVKALLDMKVDPNIIGEYGGTALVSTNQSGDEQASLQIAKLLLDAGADPNKKGPNGGPPLLGAVISGQVEKVKLLLQAKADPDTIVQADSIYLNPLMVAIFSGQEKCLETLLEGGANPNIRLGEIPLIIRFLRAGDQLPPNCTSMLRTLLKHGADPNVTDHDNVSPLMHAVACKKYNLTNTLLQFNADPNIIIPRWGISALHCAIVAENTEAVKELVHAGAHLAPAILETPPYAEGNAILSLQPGNTPLHAALALPQEESRRAIANTLLEAGVNANIPNSAGETPLDIANKQHDELLIQTLKEKTRLVSLEDKIIPYGILCLIMGIIVIIINTIRGRANTPPHPHASP